MQTCGGLTVDLQQLLLADLVEVAADIAELLDRAHLSHHLQRPRLQVVAIGAEQLEFVLAAAIAAAAATEKLRRAD